MLICSRFYWLNTAILLNFVAENVAQSRKLPPGFLLGASTASYQIEGGWNASGKGISTWDHMMLTNPDFNTDWGDVACDSYHHIDRDVEMLRELGMDVYRFSLSWPRLLPTGYVNVINPDGVQYYNNLINKLLENGITPMVTLFHWDLPQPLQDIGGWPNPDLADYFFDYANIAFRLFGDRVKLWITFNEPHQYCRHSYGTGYYAPSINETGVADYKCGHNILRAHAKVYHLYKRKFGAQNGKMSITLDCEWYEPKTRRWQPDVLASIRMLEFELGWFANPIYTPTGGYPLSMIERVAQQSRAEGFTRSRLPYFTQEERNSLIGSSDFFALNHYVTALVEDQRDNPEWPTPSRERDIALRETTDPTWKKSDAWELFTIVPWGFRKLLNWIRINYNNPLIYITESGFPDRGGLEDHDRVQYYTSYMNEMLNAIYLDNCRVIGFTAWSLMDNLEWRFGFYLKYGLYEVDFTDPARTRTPKLSAEFFKQLTKTRELPRSTENNKTLQVIAVANSPNSMEPKPSLDTSTALPANASESSPQNDNSICQPTTFGPSPYLLHYSNSLPPLFNPLPEPWQRSRPSSRMCGLPYARQNLFFLPSLF